MEKIIACIDEMIGNTPLVRVNKLNEGGAEIVAKVEYFNPGSSVKDRVAKAMLEEAERTGQLGPGGVIIEPTSGNTGIGLALMAALKGYRLILTMPETMSVERRKILQAYGAEIELTPGELGMQGSIDKAEALLKAIPGAYMPQQFDNPANGAIHRKQTAEEIWKDTDGKVDVFIACVGTGGTVSGVAEGLKARSSKIEVIAVEPAESPLLSGGQAGPHRIQGIGANFVPKNYHATVIDRVETVTADEAGRVARLAARTEGLLIGISSGAALAVALRLSCQETYRGKRIVVLLPDSGERYLSTWLFDV